MQKNVAFTSLIKFEGRLWEFNFRKNKSAQEDSFHADFTGERGQRIQFIMQQSAKGKWEATGTDLPEWIVKGAARIGRSIEEKTA